MTPAGGRVLSVAFLTSARAWRGSGVSLAEIARGLADRGHRVHLFAGETAVTAEFASRGLDAATVDTAGTGLREAAALRRRLRVAGADVLIVDRPRDLRLAALATTGSRIAILYRYNLSRRTPSRDLLTRIGHRRARLVVFLSHASAERARATSRSLAARPWRVIPNGVDPERLRPDPAAGARFRADHRLGDGPLLVTVGSLTAEKRHTLMLDALAQLADPPTLVVCGDGPLLPRLAADAGARALPVRFVGRLGPGELKGAYAAATVVVHACEVETFGLSVLEAMACGAPVVAAAGGAVPEIVGDAGVLVAPEPDAFAAAAAAGIAGLLADAGRRTALGTAARIRAAEQFPLERMRAGYADAVEQLAAVAGG